MIFTLEQIKCFTTTQVLIWIMKLPFLPGKKSYGNFCNDRNANIVKPLFCSLQEHFRF